MSFRTVEVELDRGRVRPRNAESLPHKARALLTILSPTSVESFSTDGLSLAELAGDFRFYRMNEHQVITVLAPFES
jgi:hypothetical protein